MTIAFTAIPVKITMSTIRFFLGGCMGGLFDLQGSAKLPVYSTADSPSITIAKLAFILRVD